MSAVEEIQVVLGYGCHLNAIILRYLEEAAANIRSVEPTTSLVIATGGRTAHRSAPGVSEAKMISDQLRALGVTTPIVLDEAARTTLENIRNVASIIAERGLSPKRVVIFGDRARRKKIDVLARYFLGGHPIRVRGHDLDRTRTQAIVQSTLAVAFDAIAVRVPLVEQIGLAVVERRIRRS